MKNRRNYYRILHVQPDAPFEIIKASYRTLMQTLKLHPDMGGCEEQASLINEAYSVLSDETKRAAYDQRYSLPNIESMRGDSSSSPPENQNNADDERERQKSHGSQNRKDKKIVTLCSFCNSPFYFNLEHDSRCANCASPLHPVTALELEEICQRKVQRIITGGELLFFNQWPHQGFHGRIQDLSPKGMRFIGDQVLGANNIIKIKSERLESIARVVNCRHLETNENVYSIGVEFITLLFHQITGTFVSESV